jgi:hypothetical protein
MSIENGFFFVRPTWAIAWWFKSTIHPDRGKY